MTKHHSRTKIIDREKEDLLGMAEIAIGMAKAELETTGSITPVIALQRKDHIIQLPFPLEAAGLMNEGPHKDILFSLVRRAVQKLHATAAVIATEAWLGKSLPKLLALPPGEIAKLNRNGIAWLEEHGYVSKVECICATIQTEKRVFIIAVEFTRKASGQVERYLPLDFQEFTQDQFHGRQKMYGTLDPEKGDIQDPDGIIAELAKAIARRKREHKAAQA